MLRLGVPEYRLPTEIIEREVQDILDLGIDLQLNHRITNLDDLCTQRNFITAKSVRISAAILPLVVVTDREDDVLWE